MSEPGLENFRTLRYSVEQNVATITFTRPEVRNALDLNMRDELRELVPIIRGDQSLCALIVTGSEGSFCAGGDLKALSEEQRSVEQNRERIAQLHTWFIEFSNLPLPVIAAVDGPAYGAGFNLALAADFILCSNRARFCAVFGRIGLVPDLGGFFLLPRIVGLQRAKELILTARSFDATEAQDLGIALEIHQSEQLAAAAKRFAERFRDASRTATGLAKGVLNQSLHLDQRALAEMEAYAQAVCLDSDYHRQAVQQFLAKQPLAFNWDKQPI